MVAKEKEAVISGMSGKFPGCSNVEDFKQKLFASSNLLTPNAERCLKGNETTTGKIPNWNKFDNSFFGIGSGLVKNIDPLSGHLLESSFEAMLDAGVNPYTLKGHNICVISAVTLSEGFMQQLFTRGTTVEGRAMVGYGNTMLANRISYCFNFNGPSLNYDGSWTSTAQCLEQAGALVAQGLVEAAIVTACSLVGHIAADLEFMDLNYLSSDGHCSPFDAQAHGFARSESVVSFFIQRADVAKRNYCTLIKAQGRCFGNRNCSFVEFDPSIQQFLQDFYQDCVVKPKDISYCEAHGLSVKDVDAQELNAIAAVFCGQRASPMLIGSVSGNMGNAEVTSTLVCLVKAIIAFETGSIPPTINFNTPNPDVPALVSGGIKILTEAASVPDVVAVNTMSFSGSVGHVVVRRSTSPSTKQSFPEDGLPRLVMLQARHMEGALDIIHKVNAMPVDTEYISLVNSVFRTPVPAYLWRAYTVLPAVENKTFHDVMEYDEKTKKPVWFVFSGMGSQWTGMGCDLLRIPVFADSVDKCDRVLRPRGVDIKYILTSDNPAVFDNILNCFVGIAAIQIGLVDVLRAVGVTPDGMIGHSVGELGCAYADGCFTAEEMILAAYARGRASQDSKVIPGMMAAIGMGFADIKDQLPESIDVACRNSRESCTISGPTDDIFSYVERLKSEGVFAKAVSAAGIPYHSRYIKPIGSKLIQYLKEVLPEPKPRSPRWISSSVPQSQWDTDSARLSSAEYHTNNLLNPVLFEDACKHIPEESIVVEIAPRGLLQAILKRSISSGCTNIALTKMSMDDNVCNLLNALGRLYLNNIDIDVSALYPQTQYPVSRGTPSLANVVTWDHALTQYHAVSLDMKKLLSVKGETSETVMVSMSSSEYPHWKSYSVDSQVIVPLSQILMSTWKLMLSAKKKNFDEHCVSFHNCVISKNITVEECEKLLQVSVSTITDTFEVYLDLDEEESSQDVLTGKLCVSDSITLPADVQEYNADMEEVTEHEVYSSLSHVGLQLGPQFQCIKKCFVGESGCVATVEWTGKIIPFLDALFNVVVFLETDRGENLLLVSSFKKLEIDFPKLKNLPEGTQLQVHYDMRCSRLVCEGVELLGLTLSPVSEHKPLPLVWRELNMLPLNVNTLTLKQFLSTSVHQATDSMMAVWCKKARPIDVLVIHNESSEGLVSCVCALREVVKDISDILPRVLEVDLEKAKEHLSKENQQRKQLLVGEYKSLTSLLHLFPKLENIYCLTVLNNNTLKHLSTSIRPVLTHTTEDFTISLIKKVSTLDKYSVFEAVNADWLVSLHELASTEKNKALVVVFREQLTPRHVLPILVNQPYSDQLITFFIMDKDAAKFSPTLPLYCSQLALQLPVNILYKKQWNILSDVTVALIPTHQTFDRLFTCSNKLTDIQYIGLNKGSFTLKEESEVQEGESADLECVDYCGCVREQTKMGLARFDSRTKRLQLDSVLQWDVPSGWTLEEAATVPVIYAFAYYCILLRARVKAGEDLLVHDGMSPLGQAIISVSLRSGANVFTSVRDKDEANTIRKMFPALVHNHVLLMNTQEMEVNVRNLTEGKGVGVIVSYLDGRDLQSTVNATGYDCRVFYLGSTRVQDKQSFGMSTFLKETSFNGVKLSSPAHCGDSWKLAIKEAVKVGIQQGDVRPLRKSVFSLKDQREALLHLNNKTTEEKTILTVKKDNVKTTISKKQIHDLQCQVVVAGTKTDLWIDVVEWLVDRSTQKLFILVNEKNLDGSFKRRISKVMKQNQPNVEFTSYSKLDSLDGAVKLLKNVLHVGPVSSIYFINIDENSAAMRHMDLASRQVLPQLKLFVTLLGEGSSVSECRAVSSFPVCCIKSTSQLQSPTRILPCLASLLAADTDITKFLLVSDAASHAQLTEVVDCQPFLPSSLQQLVTVSACVCQHSRPVFQEVATLSPGYQHVHNSLLPVFLVPGLGSLSLQPLTSRLLHPAFCSSLPAAYTSVEQHANILFQDVVRIQRKGPYNVVGDCWGGAVALQLSSLLGAAGHEVSLFLLDGVPLAAQDRLRALCHRFGVDLCTSLLATVTNMSQQAAGALGELQSWSEKLSVSKVPQQERGAVESALTCVYNQLTAVQQYQPSCSQFPGSLTVLANVQPAPDNMAWLSQFCKTKPRVKVVDVENYSELVSSHDTASVINEGLAFVWRM